MNYCPGVRIITFCKKFFKKKSCMFSDENYDIYRTIDYINCGPSDLVDNDNYSTIVCLYSNICQSIYNYCKDEYDTISDYLDSHGLLYGIVIDKKDAEKKYRGFCGYEEQYRAYRIYINPTMVPIFPSKRMLIYLFEVAKHEIAHLVLHAYDNTMYDFSKNVHDEAFTEVISNIENHFYNKDNILVDIYENKCIL